MANPELTISLNGKQLQVNVHTHAEGDTTYYDVLFENYTLTIYKDTMFTWASDDPHGLNHSDIQSIGEQINNA